MELILKILSSTESTIHESKTTTYQIDVTYQDQVFTINSDWTVYYGKDKVMIEDSYGKYLYKYIQENWKTLLTTKNIIKNISGTLITEDQVIARLEQDIRTALDDTKQINFYLEQIQVIRAKYLNQYKNIKLHKSNSKTEIIKEDTKTNSTSKVLVRA